MPITVKIAGVDRTEHVDARSFSIIDEVTNRASSASFDFICKDVAIAPIAGDAVLIEEDTTKLFSGRILSKEEEFLNPNQLKYSVECVDHTRDLDKLLVTESYVNQKGGDIIKDIIDTYTVGFTYVNVQDGPTLTKIAFDHIQVSEAITQIAEACGYQWYIDYDKDLYFFLVTDYPASFGLDDDQKHYKELVINYDISQLRNRVYVKSSKYITLDFTEKFVGDGVTVTWTCKYLPTALPAPTLTLDGVAHTVGWTGVDNPDDFDFMLAAATGVLSLGTFEATPAVGEEIVPTYGADVPIIVQWDDEDSIAAVTAIEGGDGIFEFCITNNKVDTKEWAIDLAKADLLENADPVIKGSFITNESSIRSGQIITLNSAKRNITQDFLVQKVELIRVDVNFEYAKEPYKPAVSATIGYKPAADGEIPYRSVGGGWVIYYIYEVTIATKLKGLEDLLLQLLYQSGESLKRDTEAPDVPTGLALTTGMGEITQAGLTWLKAAWDANTEVDFDHYELKYKKTAYADFGMVNTLDTTYLWESLEQNVEWQVYIRAVDIYGNRSAWSGVQTQTTANDTDAPTQVASQTATAILAGIKVQWDLSVDTNIAYYKVERQESDDGTTWVAGWVEVARVTVDIWLDLFLSYIKFYRYRITAYSQTGIAGVTSGVTADSIAASKTGANDIVANSITADQIAANAITANAILAGEIETAHLAAGAISLATIASDFNWSTLVDDGNKPDDNADVTGDNQAADIINLPATPAGAGLYANGTYLGYYTGTAWKAFIQNNGNFYFGNATNTKYVQWNGTNLTIIGALSVSSATIRGRLTVGGGTNEDIYFEDSGIRMYDYGTTTIRFYKAGVADFKVILNAGVLHLWTDEVNLTLGVDGTYFIYRKTGQLQLPTLAGAPIANNANGQIAAHAVGWLRNYFNGAWYKLDVTSGW